MNSASELLELARQTDGDDGRLIQTDHLILSKRREWPSKLHLPRDEAFRHLGDERKTRSQNASINSYKLIISSFLPRM